MGLLVTVGMTLAKAIAVGVTAGVLIAYAVRMTIEWFNKKVKSLFAKYRAKKVIAVDLEHLVNECSNTVDLADLLDEGHTDVIAAVDSNGKVTGKVDLIENTDYDREIEEIYGDEGMVVVKG